MRSFALQGTDERRDLGQNGFNAVAPKFQGMILIRTHHKTGTLWMLRVFQGIADTLSLKFCHLHAGYPDLEACKVQTDFISDADLYLSPHMPFPWELTEGNFRGVHLIRDPRDVILSGMHYHLTSDESWLHLPRLELGGLTYQQKLRSLGDDDRLYFEMQNVGYETIRCMAEWNYHDERFFEVRYEDLVGADGPVLFAEVLSFLGISGEDAERSLRIFRNSSLSAANYTRVGDPHVRSGRPRQWKTEFRARHGQRFLETVGDCLVVLGYEKDDSWVQELPD